MSSIRSPTSAASTPKSRRRSTTGRAKRSRRRQAKELAQRLREENEAMLTPAGESARDAASRAQRRRSSVQHASRRASALTSRQAPVKISRSTLLAFYEGIGSASTATQELQAGKLPARGKTLRTLGYSTIDLFMATVKSDVAIVRRFLAAGEPADARPARFPNETPLHAAAILGNTDMMKVLLDGGAPVNATDMNGNTALHYAVRGGHASAVSLLLSRQADPSARNRLGLNANRLAMELGLRDVASLLPTTKELALRRIRTAGKLRAMMGSLKKLPFGRGKRKS